MSRSTRSSWGRIMNLFSFIAVIFIGIAIMLGFIFRNSPDFANALETIAEVLAYIVVAFGSFIWVSSRSGKNRLVWWIMWAVALTLIIIFRILS